MRINSRLSIIFIFAMIYLGPVTLQAKAEDSDGGNFVYDDHGKRDPFWKLIGARGVIVNYDKDLMVSDLVLEGIMEVPGGGNAAIINGNIIKLNDHVGMYTVVDINATTVTLQKGTETFKLQLKKED